MAELTEEQKLFLDRLSPSEFEAYCSNTQDEIPKAVLDHYRETYLWWAPIIWGIDGNQYEVDVPGTIPEPERLERASERGTFLVEDLPDRRDWR